MFVLILDWTKITGKGLRMLKELPKLKTLSCGATIISGADIAYLTKTAKSLEKLGIFNLGSGN